MDVTDVEKTARMKEVCARFANHQAREEDKKEFAQLITSFSNDGEGCVCLASTLSEDDEWRGVAAGAEAALRFFDTLNLVFAGNVNAEKKLEMIHALNEYFDKDGADFETSAGVKLFQVNVAAMIGANFSTFRGKRIKSFQRAIMHLRAGRGMRGCSRFYLSRVTDVAMADSSGEVVKGTENEDFEIAHDLLFNANAKIVSWRIVFDDAWRQRAKSLACVHDLFRAINNGDADAISACCKTSNGVMPASLQDRPLFLNPTSKRRIHAVDSDGKRITCVYSGCGLGVVGKSQSLILKFDITGKLL